MTLVIVINTKFAVPTSWHREGNSQEITGSCRELQAVPRFAIFLIALQLTTFGEHVSSAFTSGIRPKVVGVCNHSETWRESFGLGIHAVVPTIVGAREEIWGTGVSFCPIAIVGDLVNGGMPI
jgi:hypothetical protein